MAAFVLSKFIKKNNPGKTREIARNTPRIARNPREFFFGLGSLRFKGFFPFSAVCLCEVAMETRETFEALLAGLKAGGCHPQLKRLQKLLVCLDRLFGHTKKPYMCVVFCSKGVKPLKWPNRRVMSLKPVFGKCYAMDCFGTYFAHVQTCDNVRVQSATQWTASVHTSNMSVQTCDNVRVQSATQWTASVHTLHMSKPVITFLFKVLRNGLLPYILYTCPSP